MLMQALGLAVVAIGLRMALEAQHTLLAIGCLLLGGVTGELLRIEQRLDNLAETLSRTCDPTPAASSKASSPPPCCI